MSSEDPGTWCARCHRGHPFGERCPYKKWNKNIHQKRAARKRKSSELKKHKDFLLTMHPFCNRCGVELDSKSAELDHIKSLMRGGTNQLDNLQLLCANCHQDKTNHEISIGKKLNG